MLFATRTSMIETTIDQQKGPYHHGNLRSALIEASLRILREDGLDALSLRRAAREANVSPAAPYRHFKDKQTLLCSLSEYGFRELHKELEHSRLTNPGDLDAAGRAYVAFAQREPQCYRLMFTLNLQSDEESKAGLTEAGDLAFESLCSNIRQGIEIGSITPADESELALAAWSMVHGICMLMIDGSLSDRPTAQGPPEQLLTYCLNHFRNGWRGPATPPDQIQS